MSVYVGARLRPSDAVAFPSSLDVPPGPRDVEAIRCALDDIDGCTADQGGALRTLTVAGVAAYVVDRRLGAGEFGAVYGFRRAPGCVSSQLFVCAKVFFRTDDFDRELAIVDALRAAPHEDDTDRVVARAAVLSERHRVVLMEYGDGSLARLAGSLTARQAAAVVAAMLREARGVYRVASLICADAKSANFLYRAPADGDVRVMACDYGGYAPENESVEACTYVHPLVQPGDPVVANVANCVFSCGATLLTLLKVNHRDLVDSNRAVWGADDHSRLRRIMREFSHDMDPRLARVACALVHFDASTGRFVPTQGQGAARASFDEAIDMLDAFALGERGGGVPASGTI